MNVLLSAVGRRVEIVKWFKKVLKKVKGKLFVCDIDENIPALYFANRYFIPSVNNKISEIIKFCKDNDIKFLMTLIDNELELFANNEKLFNDNGITLLQSTKEVIDICYDKLWMYEKWKNINQPKTDVDVDKNKNWIYKKRKGSASLGFNNRIFCQESIMQEQLTGKEYNVSVYFDFISGNLIDIFMCEKILMRAGETERATPTWEESIYIEIKKLENIKGFKGFIDIDLFITNENEVKVIDINPRIGGGYPFAHMVGKNYFIYLIKNMNGIENKILLNPYQYYQQCKIFKYQDYFIKDEDYVDYS